MYDDPFVVAAAQDWAYDNIPTPPPKVESTLDLDEPCFYDDDGLPMEPRPELDWRVSRDRLEVEQFKRTPILDPVGLIHRCHNCGCLCPVLLMLDPGYMACIMCGELVDEAITARVRFEYPKVGTFEPPTDGLFEIPRSTYVASLLEQPEDAALGEFLLRRSWSTIDAVTTQGLAVVGFPKVVEAFNVYRQETDDRDCPVHIWAFNEEVNLLFEAEHEWHLDYGRHLIAKAAENGINSPEERHGPLMIEWCGTQRHQAELFLRALGQPLGSHAVLFDDPSHRKEAIAYAPLRYHH